MREGNLLYEQEKFEEALQSYQEALVIEPDNPRIHYSIGRALYKLEEYDETLAEFQLGLLSKDRAFQAWNLYNMGNCHFRNNQLEAAIDAYRNSLILDPTDVEAKQNLEFCLRLKEQLETQPEADSLNQQQQEQQQQQQEQEEQQQQEQQGQKPQPEPQDHELSQEEANLILQALEGKEKENLKKSRGRGEKEDVEKDW
jgi:Ca-activated chloride channel family protein